jgi:hypothetical protein
VALPLGAHSLVEVPSGFRAVGTGFKLKSFRRTSFQVVTVFVIMLASSPRARACGDWHNELQLHRRRLNAA